jgi:hypothetical protein
MASCGSSDPFASARTIFCSPATGWFMDLIYQVWQKLKFPKKSPWIIGSYGITEMHFRNTHFSSSKSAMVVVEFVAS